MEKIRSLGKSTKKHSDRLAEKAADTCTRLSGRETTSDEVKKAALIVGSVAASWYLLTTLQTGLCGGGAEATLAAGGETMSDPGLMDNGWDGSTNDDAFWEQDAINYDQQQYDLQQDHLAYESRLDFSMDDQVNYNQEF